MESKYDQIMKTILNLNGEVDKPKSKFDLLIEKIRQFWWKYILYIIGTSIMLLFILSFIFDKSISINTMNSWLGIVLGLVATIIGVISMILSFYNLDQSINTQKETVDMINNLKNEIIKKIDKSFKETQDIVKENTTDKNDLTTSKVDGSFKKTDLNLNLKRDEGDLND